MAASLRRLDGTYTASHVPPMVELAGKVPETIRVLYDTFTARYPNTTTASFRAINTNVLAEVGVNIVLLNNRLDINFRVDQISVRAVSLIDEDEVKFAVDCILIMNNVLGALNPAIVSGLTQFNLSTWLSIDGGRDRVQKVLSTVLRPTQASRLKNSRLGAKRIEYIPHVSMVSEVEGWRLAFMAEPSALPEADLFISRHYTFMSGTKYSGFEEQFAFIQTSATVISDWLGIA